MGNANDFDFLIGDWTVHHRRLAKRLENNTEWIEFTGAATVRKVLRGLGNFDEIAVNLPEDPYLGATLRLFNPETETWSIHWMDSRRPGTLDPPMNGRFENGVGVFFGDDTFNGKPIRIRFIWKPRHWEQAFSADGGTTWETNWTMDFERPLRAELLGHWTLVSLTIVNGTEVEYPMGRDVSGVITYDEAGHMAAQIMQADRPPFSSGDINDGTFEELSAALTGYTAYFGTYTVDESARVVTHHVRGSLFPNWVGTEQRREIAFDGDQLTLSSQPILFKGKTRVFRATWRR